MTSSTPSPENHDADLLASLYLDGEASPEEAAVVEATPDLMARVEAFRSVAGQLSEPVRPPATLQRAHIAAALDAFEAKASAPVIQTQEPPVVVDLAERRARRGLPSWLGAAAATVVVVGGLGFGLNALNSSSGSSDEASEAVSSREGGTANSETTSAADTAEELLAADSATDDSSSADAAMDDSAMADTAMEDEEATDESAMAEEAEPAGDDGGSDEVRAPPFDPGPVDGRSALEIADTVPAAQILPIEEATCFGSSVETSLDELTGFVPVVVDGEPGELLLFLTPDAGGQLVPGAVVLGPDCEPILE